MEGAEVVRVRWGGGQGCTKMEGGCRGSPGQAHFPPRRQQVMAGALRVPKAGLEVLVQVHVRDTLSGRQVARDPRGVVLHKRHLLQAGVWVPFPSSVWAGYGYSVRVS